MAENKVKWENFIALQGWQVAGLGLKGNELIIYACIYGFSQDDQKFSGSLQYLADWTNSTKQGVIKCLKSLVEKGLIVKEEKIINGVKFCEYYTTELNTLLNKVEYPIKQSLTPPIKQSLPNNIDINTIENNIEIREEEKPAPIPYKLIFDMYNDICISLPRAIKITDDRKVNIRARLEDFTVDDFKILFTKAEASDFLKGNKSTERNWSATFDWLINRRNMVKVLEGNYDNNRNAAAKAKYDLSHLKANNTTTNNSKEYF